MNVSVDVISVYTILLVISLWLNGIVTVMRQPLPELFSPLRNRRLLGGSLLIDVLLVPIVILTLAWLLPGVSDGMRVGLVLIAAASTGPISSVLTRIVRGDVPLAVSLVTAFGALNLITVPALGALLLSRSVTFPLRPVLTSMVLLVFLPLVVGVLYRRVTHARAVDPKRVDRQMKLLGVSSTVFLAAAIMIALVADFGQVLEMLAGPVGVLSLGTMVVIGVAAFGVGDTLIRRATLAIVLNARGGGLALTVAALHFSTVDDVRAAVVTFSLVTQVLPTVLVLLRGRFPAVTGEQAPVV